MPELQPIDLTRVRQLSPDNYGKGVEYFRKGAVSGTWRTAEALHALVSGSASQPYDVSTGPRENGSYWAKCSCPAARRQSICKHAAALLVAWAENPTGFILRAEPGATANSAPKLDSQAKRARAPKADRRDLIAAGLEKAETLLVDLASQGLTTTTREQVETIGTLVEALEAHKLRRLSRQVAEIQRAASSAQKDGSSFDERNWARLLSDGWFVLLATRKALENQTGSDGAELEELVGKTWLEKDLRRVENLELLELAYETAVLSSGFRVETSYLLDLREGALYTEKQITPTKLKDAPRKKSYSRPLRVAAMGIYPGYAPLRVKMIDVIEEADGEGTWDRAIGLAETSAAALKQRLIQSTASLTAPQEIYSLFRPAAVLSDGERLYLLDQERKAIPVEAQGRARAWALREALLRGPLGAVLCKVRFGGAAMEAEPLSVVLRAGAGRLVRLTA